MPQPLSSFIARNAAAFGAQTSLLWINPPGDAPWRELGAHVHELSLFCQDRADHDRLRAAAADPGFGDFPPPDTPPDTSTPDAILLTLPREKTRLRMLAQWAAATLPAAGRLWIAGENQAGIKSCARQLDGLFGQADKRDSARHCALIEARKPVANIVFDPEAWRETWRLDRSEGSLTIHSWPGVFAHGELDPGTALLLDHLPDLAAGARVLDFGCGAGVIGAAVLLRQPACQLTLADSSALALRSTRATLAANGLAATVLAADGLATLSGSFDWVISNPPWHERHVEQRALGMELLQDIRAHLAPGGRLLLVANRHLPWPAWLERCFGRHDCIARNARFQVLYATNAR